MFKAQAFTLTLLCLIQLAPATSSADNSSDDEPVNASALPEPETWLKKRIDFWVRIYSEFTTSHAVIHDAKFPEIVFEVFDQSTIINDYTLTPKQREKKIKNKIKELKDYYTSLLLSVHEKLKTGTSLNEAERRIVDLYKDVDEPQKFFNAAHSKRVRHQLGQKDRFAQGLFYSGRYLSEMEKSFKEQGLPQELSRLPFVESSFNIKARSKVGASGIWQFMRSTGNLYLKINNVGDERNDRFMAAQAAASLLNQNFQSLGRWPLAITAYNHGRKGMMRAQSKLGTNRLSEIIQNYRSRSFGFASSNFYCEFMAALEVEKNAEKYFGSLERDKPVASSEVVLNDYVALSDLSTYARIPMDTLIDLNPSLTDAVIKGKLLVPAGFHFKVPQALRENFLAAYNEIPITKKFSRQKGNLIGKKF